MENKFSGRISSCRTRYGKRQPECGSAHSNKGPSCRFSSAFMCSVLGLAKQQHKPLPCTSHSCGGRGYFKRAHAVASQAPYMWPEYPQINNFRTLAQTSLRYFKQMKHTQYLSHTLSDKQRLHMSESVGSRSFTLNTFRRRTN
jgi:hypothetical protein